jgi:integrase
MTTALEDELIARHPCRIRGAGHEPAPERPVATIRQVFQLAERMPAPFRALVLFATFTGLRWGELAGLRRRDLDLDARQVRVARSVAEMSDGRRLVGPPKSAAGYRRLSIPGFLVPVMVEHLREFAEDGQDGHVFVGPRGGPLRRQNFAQTARWHEAVAAVGVPNLHFHDLRHTGNTLAAPLASTRELMARLGHNSPRAALIYQYATDERDRVIADGLDELVRGELGLRRLDEARPGDVTGT